MDNDDDAHSSKECAWHANVSHYLLSMTDVYSSFSRTYPPYLSDPWNLWAELTMVALRRGGVSPSETRRSWISWRLRLGISRPRRWISRLRHRISRLRPSVLRSACGRYQSISGKIRITSCARLSIVFDSCPSLECQNWFIYRDITIWKYIGKLTN